MKKIIIFLGIVICACTSPNEKIDFSSNNNNQKFLVQLKNFDSDIETELIKRLDNNTFFLRKYKIYLSKDTIGHRFYLNQDIKNFSKVIIVKKMLNKPKELKVNIKFYKNKNQQLEQYFNPGTFSRTVNSQQEYLDMLEHIITSLTYK